MPIFLASTWSVPFQSSVIGSLIMVIIYNCFNFNSENREKKHLHAILLIWNMLSKVKSKIRQTSKVITKRPNHFRYANAIFW